MVPSETPVMVPWLSTDAISESVLCQDTDCLEALEGVQDLDRVLFSPVFREMLEGDMIIASTSTWSLSGVSGSVGVSSDSFSTFTVHLLDFSLYLSGTVT